MSRSVLHIVSGIPPGASGTGRLLSHLRAQAQEEPSWDVRFHYPRRAEVGIRSLLRSRRYARAVATWLTVALSRLWLGVKLVWLARFGREATLVFHPQTLGFARTLSFLRACRGRAFLFGLDNSFFCLRSYNHVPGETGDCLRCLGGNFEAAVEHKCEPFPVRDQAAQSFVRGLHALLRQGGVGVLVQNRLNAGLYRRHLGGWGDVQVVGLWTADWTQSLASSPVAAEAEGFDVVFHANFVEAKGSRWLVEVARRLPEISFLFPASLPSGVTDLPDNITFRAMSWEAGLAAEVAAARIVCVPSLWSATIEGALVKSIIFGKSTARVRTAAAYGEELPEGLVLNLDPDCATAAEQLKTALSSGWEPEPRLRDAWVDEFKRENFYMLGRILRAIERTLKGGGGDQRLQKVAALEQMRAADAGVALEKLGTRYGGWVVPVDRIDESWVCYCAGAGEDISFDCELLERFGCEVFVFDPTPRAVGHVAELKRRVAGGEPMPINNKPEEIYHLAPEKLERLHFRPYGVWSADVTQRFYVPQDESHVSHSILNLQRTENFFEADCRKLSSLMQEFGHERIDLLKLDIEGAEYEVLKAMLADGVHPTVLCVEFDEGNMPLDGNAAGRIGEVAEALGAAGYALVQQDGWNTTFIRKEASSFSASLGKQTAH